MGSTIAVLAVSLSAVAAMSPAGASRTGLGASLPSVASDHGHGASDKASSGQKGAEGRNATTSTTTTTTAPPPMTSCQSVVDIGDSTSESLIESEYLYPAQQLPAQYQRVGVKNVNLQISGARSIVETYDGQPSGYEVVQSLIGQGYKGCWVIALGTNDTADVAAGSEIGMAQRIQMMMAAIGDQPVMWVNVITELTSGDYAESGMQQWNETLLQACPHYPDMRVYNWAAVAQDQPSWFISDGIHYTSLGSQYRAADFANALAQAFPASPPAASDHGKSTSPNHSRTRSTSHTNGKGGQDQHGQESGGRRATTTTRAHATSSPTRTTSARSGSTSSRHSHHGSSPSSSRGHSTTTTTRPTNCLVG
jgi:hypothetical protein